ncbi:MAG: hypothetical protein ACR2PR_01725 [Pseudohongiellaceae bacterium]
MLDSPLWSLFYIAATLVMMGFAYYSRSESIQKMGLYIFVTNMISHGVFDTDLRTPVYLAIDAIGFLYAMRLTTRLKCRACGYVMTIFAAMVFAHNWAELGLVHIIAGNLLYLAQLAILCKYGKQYGRAERCTRDDNRRRTDPFYRFGVLLAWKR